MFFISDAFAQTATGGDTASLLTSMLPMILIFGQIRGAYLGGSLLTFFLGYCILFFKSGFLLSAYKFIFKPSQY